MKIKLNAVQQLALSFSALILVGAILLSLPIASKGDPLPFLHALFTSTSASCVTGLVLYDTFTQFSMFGQAVILILIQIGGLSLMTIAALICILLQKQIGLHQRSVLMDTVGALQVGGIVRFVKRALLVTACCEVGGMILLAPWFVSHFGTRGIWMAVFHAISSYCNAGFDLLGTGSSLTSIGTELWPNLVLMSLVIFGGLGFLVWDDILTYHFHFRKWHLHSKIVFTTTLSLFVVGAVFFFFLENHNTMEGYSFGQKVLLAFFQSVTCRTAGFNTLPLNECSSGTTFLSMLLMIVGAGSGSTGGGLKINTVAIILLTMYTRVRRKQDVEIFHRRINDSSVQKAQFALSTYMFGTIIGTLILTFQGLPLQAALYEVLSAIGTVGLTLGYTSLLPTLSKITIIAIMFAGRVGSMSVIMAMTADKPQPKIHYVTEDVLVG